MMRCAVNLQCWCLVVALSNCAILLPAETPKDAQTPNRKPSVPTSTSKPTLTFTATAKVKIALVGDSTVTDKSGWGGAFAQRLAPGVECLNCARSGRSSKSFRSEGWWLQTLGARPDYVLIQFGHNDMPGKGPDRETNPATTYREYLTQYVQEARAIGATPILVTSVVRRNFNDRQQVVSDLSAYASAAQAVAQAERAPLVNLHDRSLELVNQLGPDRVARFNPPNVKQPGQPDTTHLNAAGAEAMAALVVDELRRNLPASATWFAETPSKAQRMNVLFLVVDDLRCSLGCYGDREAKTPNIDRLAASAVRFDRAYCQYPVCNPSRTSFLTGLRPDTTAILDNEVPFRQRHPAAITLPQWFRQHGWHTTGLGKVVHKGIDAHGKTVFHEDPASWDDCRNFSSTKLGDQGEGRYLSDAKQFRWLHWLAANGADDDQPDGQLATAAIQVLEQRRHKPFFLAVGFHKPHDPFHAPRKYFDLHPLAEIQLHQPPADRSTEVPLAIPKDGPLQALDEQQRRELKRAYLACTSFTDAQIGRVLEALERLELNQRTIVVLFSDHGYHLGQHDWWNKVTLFETCARVPLIVRVPGAAGNGRSASGLVELVDLFPTLAESAGLPVPPHLAGASVRRLCDDPTLPGKAAAYTQMTRGNARTVRTDRYRYTEWDSGRNGIELYDHQHDPDEYHNLAESPEHVTTRAELSNLLPRSK